MRPSGYQPSNKINDLEMRLQDLALRRELLEKRSKEKQQLINGFANARKDSLSRLMQSFQEQNELAKKRNAEILEDLILTMHQASKKNDSVLAANLNRNDSKSQLVAAKREYTKMLEKALPMVHRAEALRLEERMKHIKIEKVESMQRRKRLQQELVKEERVRYELEVQRKELIHNLALEQGDLLRAKASSLLLAEESKLADAEIVEQMHQLGSQLQQSIDKRLQERQLEGIMPPLAGNDDSIGGIFIPNRSHSPSLRTQLSLSSSSLAAPGTSTSSAGGSGKHVTIDENLSRHQQQPNKRVGFPSAQQSEPKGDPLHTQSLHHSKHVMLRSEEEEDEYNIHQQQATPHRQHHQQRSSSTNHSQLRDIEENDEEEEEEDLPLTQSQTLRVHQRVSEYESDTLDDEHDSIVPLEESSHSIPASLPVANPISPMIASPDTTVSSRVSHSASANSNVNKIEPSTSKSVIAEKSDEGFNQQHERLSVPSVSVDEQAHNALDDSDEFGSVALDDSHNTSTQPVAQKAASGASGGTSTDLTGVSSSTAAPILSSQNSVQSTAALVDVASLPRFGDHGLDVYVKLVQLPFFPVKGSADDASVLERLETAIGELDVKYSPLDSNSQKHEDEEKVARMLLRDLLRQHQHSNVSADVQRIEYPVRVLGSFVLLMLAAKGSLLIPKEYFTGVVTFDKLKKDLKKTSGALHTLTCWDTLVKHWQRCIQVSAPRLAMEQTRQVDYLARTVTQALIDYVPRDDKDRMQRKVYNILQLEMLPSDGISAPTSPAMPSRPFASAVEVVSRSADDEDSDSGAKARSSQQTAHTSRPQFNYQSMLGTSQLRAEESDELASDEEWERPPMVKDLDALTGKKTVTGGNSKSASAPVSDFVDEFSF